MKVSLLQYTRCPECGNAPLVVGDGQNGDIEEGVVSCTGCGGAYAVHAGVLDLHPNPTAGAQAEMSGHRRIGERWLEDSVPEELRPSVTGAAGEALYRNLPRVEQPEVAAAVPAFARLNEIADDYFELLDWLDIRPGARVLEVGAHNGWSAQHFARRGAEVIATDISPDLQAAALYFDGEVYFERVYADMLVMPFNEACFDLVFTVATVHHTDDLAALYRGFHRVLKPGGRAVLFTEPVAGRWDRTIKETFGAEEKEWGAQEHIYTISEYLTPAQRAGFRAAVIPQTGLLREADRKWPRVRRLALALHRHGWLYAPALTRWVYPFLLQYYPRIPFPRFAMVLWK